MISCLYIPHNLVSLAMYIAIGKRAPYLKVKTDLIQTV